MKAIAKVLLATDFSQASQHALEHAALIAARHDAELHVVHARVVGDDDPQDFPPLEAYQAALDALARANLEQLSIPFEVPVHTHTERGISAAQAILRAAEGYEADLIVMGSHGRGWLPHVLLGSVTQRVVRASTRPVLVVGRAPEHRPRGERYSRVLVPVDFSEPSLHAFEQAAVVARQHGSELVAIYVVEPPREPLFYVSSPAPPLDPLEHTDRARRALQARLDSVAGVTTSARIASGRPEDAITSVATEVGADLLVIASSGRRGFDKLVLGSVTERVLRRCPCPALVVRGDEHLSL